MSGGASFNRKESFQAYATPPEFIASVKRRFQVDDFDWDLAADAENAKAKKFFAVTHDALSRDWAAECSGDCWLNPPFSNIAPWAAKCAATGWLPQRVDRPGRIFLLVPAAVGSNWFARLVDGSARVYFLNGRICFDGKGPYPKDCCLCIYGEPPGYEVWRWKDSTTPR